MTTFMLEWHNLLASRPGNLTPQALSELEGQLEAAPLSQEEATQRPHIIVIVNESFCDPQQLGIETSEDPLPFLHSLESCIRGNVYVSAFGGSTGNTEHSFLTATIPPPMLTMPLLSTVRETTPSLASYLRGLGYTTLAMHPSAPENYQRDMVYPLLGFDRFIDRSGFQNPERIRELITDRSCYEKLVELYENRLPGERLFAYIMTIQNHGGYLIGGVPGEISVSGAENLGWEEHAEQEEYVRLLRQSDEAMEELIGYFSRQTEPVVLLFFGDHQPMLRGLSDERPSQTEAQRFFRDQWTPFWIWSNGSLEQMDGCEVSVNYLSSLLLKAAGVPLSAYDAWLLKQSETYPIVLQMGYADAQGSEGKWSADGLWPKTLQQLNLARYNRLGRACDRLPGLATGE